MTTTGTPRLPGSPEPLAEGELVMFTDRKQRRYLLTLVAGKQWHSHAGSLDFDDIIGRPEGCAARTNKNMEITALRPTLEDFALKMKRGAQVVYPKDQAMITSLADIRPGCTVVEAGAGSGALTMTLLDAVGPAGKVISFERREDHLDIARENVERWYGKMPDNWELRFGDLATSLPDVPCHRIVLDMLEPWLMVEGATAALAPGGILLAYMPTVTQVMRFSETIDESPAFGPAKTSETLVRGWDVNGLAVRPAHRMVAHTAFLTVARRVVPIDEGGPTFIPKKARAVGPEIHWVDARGQEDSADAPEPAPRQPLP
ncbi:MAG: tRNA (adenine57-N1/adenine58-N1)-methyltransferase [Glaciecola sp.]|jgi:tRNA (adenine57-N1/adenine58-N1)-methyltransferase